MAWGGQCQRGFDRQKRSGSKADGSDQCWVSVRMEDRAEAWIGDLGLGSA